MNRRDVLKSLTPAAAAVSGLLTISDKLCAETVPEIVESRTLRRDGFYLRRIREVVSYVRGVSRGLYSGWGLALHELTREEVNYPLPTQPVRTHASWPHLHCLCHCTAAADIEGDRETLSMQGGIGDELYQALSANLFPSVVYPMIYMDVAAHYGRNDEAGVRENEKDMVLIMNYLFGEAPLRKRSLFLVGLRSRESRDGLKNLRVTMYALVDALESAWQRSDFLDNAVGREGGCRCPQDLSPVERVRWCRKWCTQKQIPTDTPEGPETPRPWGPYHPLYPGPVPTFHETLYGDLQPVDDPDMQRPHPLYAPLPELVVPDIRGFNVVG